eukprot:7560686-Alexandrium_andersonii.AAC.1
MISQFAGSIVHGSEPAAHGDFAGPTVVGAPGPELAQCIAQSAPGARMLPARPSPARLLQGSHT